MVKNSNVARETSKAILAVVDEWQKDRRELAMRRDGWVAGSELWSSYNDRLIARTDRAEAEVLAAAQWLIGDAVSPMEPLQGGALWPAREQAAQRVQRAKAEALRAIDWQAVMAQQGAIPGVLQNAMTVDDVRRWYTSSDDSGRIALELMADEYVRRRFRSGDEGVARLLGDLRRNHAARMATPSVREAHEASRQLDVDTVTAVNDTRAAVRLLGRGGFMSKGEMLLSRIKIAHRIEPDGSEGEIGIFKADPPMVIRYKEQEPSVA